MDDLDKKNSSPDGQRARANSDDYNRRSTGKNQIDLSQNDIKSQKDQEKGITPNKGSNPFEIQKMKPLNDAYEQSNDLFLSAFRGVFRKG